MIKDNYYQPSGNGQLKHGKRKIYSHNLKFINNRIENKDQRFLKGNDIKRAKGGVGIVPYVYDDAQKYYEAANRILEERYRNQIIPKINQNKKEVIKIEKQKREGLLDLGGL